MPGATLGFGTELEHFREVVQQRVAAVSDMASAAATLRLTSEIADGVLRDVADPD